MNQLSIHSIAAAQQLLYSAVLTLYEQGIKEQGEQPVIFITLGSIKHFKVGNESLGYLYFAVCCKCQHLFAL